MKKIKYQQDGGLCKTLCPHNMKRGGIDIYVNSTACQKCPLFGGVDEEKQILYCEKEERDNG